jgi:hypothetical protein
VRTLPPEETPTDIAGTAALLLSAPLQAQAGREFAVAISVPPDRSGSAQLDLFYDRTRLQPVGVPTDNAGQLPLTVSGTVTVRFKALEGRSGPAQLSVGNVSAPDGAPLVAPPPLTVNVTP